MIGFAMAPLISATIDGNLDNLEVKWKEQNAMCLILASGGYPEKYEKGFEIKNLNVVENNKIVIFQAGTRADGDSIVTNGGRVLGITGIGNDWDELREQVYAAAEKIDFKGKYYRKDIGLKKEGTI